MEDNNDFNSERDTWEVIQQLLSKRQYLIRHQLDSYNDFIDRLRDNNSKNCIRRLLTDCLKIPESTMYFNELVIIITKFLGSIFAKTLNSSQNDMMLILYGGMNLGKTRFLQSLFGYFAREESRSYFRVVDKISLKDNNDKDLLIL